MPLFSDNLEEICQDIKEQVENGVCECPLFSMTLCPEGNPPADKATLLASKYRAFKERLDEMGIKSGILVQASVGHGWILGEMFPYQPHVNFTDGKATRSACPMDKGFKKYISGVLSTLARENPDCIMIDDDFRTIWFKGEGCSCPLHMELFNKMAGTSLSDRELWEIVNQKTPLAKEYTDIFIKAQKKSLLDTARIMRKAVDSVHPNLPMSYCCCGNNAEFAYEIASILAGKGNPVTVRINNGNYTPLGAKGFSRVFHRCATQIAKLRGRVDVILAETDTCPQTRYSVSASSLHTHFTGSILEGANGAKHWITRLLTFEPEGGLAYRKILSEHRGFYEKLAALQPTLKWRGCRIYVPDTPDFTYGRVKEEWDGWSYCALERLGLPMFFSSRKGGCLCLEGDVVSRLSDKEILKALSGPCFIASDTAASLRERGFGNYLGVHVREWKGKQPVQEIFADGKTRNKIQMKTQELVPISADVKVLSTAYNTVDYESFEPLFPAVTMYKNELGGTICVFCGTPVAEFNLVEAFSFLCYARKKQLAYMLSKCGELPVYCPTDTDMYLKAADMKDGRLFCACINLSLDSHDKLELICRFTPSKIKYLTPDGSEKEASFTVENGVCILDLPCKTLDPVVVFIEK